MPLNELLEYVDNEFEELTRFIRLFDGGVESELPFFLKRKGRVLY